MARNICSPKVGFFLPFSGGELSKWPRGSVTDPLIWGLGCHQHPQTLAGPGTVRLQERSEKASLPGFYLSEPQILSLSLEQT